MTYEQLTALLLSLNSAVLIWLCFERDRLHKRINMLFRVINEMSDRLEGGR